jgi:hypothetical protein
MASSPPSGVQTLVYFLEEGAGRLWIRRFLVFICFVSVVIYYHFLEARNFAAPEAMDQAQVARNLATGKGFTTLNIRPLSVYLRQSVVKAEGGDPKEVLRTPHPDLENAPVYPALIAGLMKVLPEDYRSGKPIQPYLLHRPPPEIAIGWLNYALFLLAVWLVWYLGKSVFDPQVGIVSALILYGSELMWRFVYSGLSTILLLVVMALLTATMMALERTLRNPEAKRSSPVLFVMIAGVLLGIGCLTRYSVGWFLVPVLIFTAQIAPGRRWSLMCVLTLAFGLTISPWVIRNIRLSGMPFGTATYALLTETPAFPDNRLERSQTPQIHAFEARDAVGKILSNSVTILEEQLPWMGGSWISAFFLVGLMLPYKDLGRRRLRSFVVLCVFTAMVVQAGAQTGLSKLNPTVTSENLLALVFPVVCLFGGGLVETLLEAREFPFPLALSMARIGVVMVTSMPLVLAMVQAIFSIIGFAPRRHYVLMDPTYQPSVISEVCAFTPEGSLIMSDIPWAVAWYGGRESMWLPLRVSEAGKEDFYAIHFQRKVRAIYISPLTTNAAFRDRFLLDPDLPWGLFYVDILLRTHVPDGFPLRFADKDYLTFGHCFLAEQDWWRPRSKS